MRSPRFRVRTLMIAVAVVALVIGLPAFLVDYVSRLDSHHHIVLSGILCPLALMIAGLLIHGAMRLWKGDRQDRSN